MSEQILFFDKETAALLVQDAADLVLKQLVVDHKIRLDNEQLESLAKTAVKHISLEIDYDAIADNLVDKITGLKDSSELFMGEAIKGDLFEKIKKEIKKPVNGVDGKDGLNGEKGKDGSDGKIGLPGLNGKDYTLTAKDKMDIAATLKKSDKQYKITEKIRADIATVTLSDFMKDEKAVQAIVDAVIADEQIITRDGIVKKLKDLRRLIDLSKKQRKGGINAGISGQDMIDEINKTLGQTTWQTGGFGSIEATVNFNGIGVLSVRASRNILSIVDNGVGDYALTLLNTSIDPDFTVLGTAGGISARVAFIMAPSEPTTTSVRINVFLSATGFAFDSNYVSVAIVR